MASRIDEIEIWADEPDELLKTVGRVEVKVTAATLLSKTPTIEDANLKLREEASRLAADAVVHVSYKRGMSAASWKALWATGIAVVYEREERACPFCAEPIKPEAIRCKHCGSDLPPPG